ncbi:uncharacterized mitochondrial protein AtMg00810-like [Capsicum annuum]|uniref:uncharacterized mitochondrial protein AtMg00810-like n=1 Tax=Capsicum annuum TaxID=4072 RepID=UPI0007BF7142|nr:uncharacterized mitochondrial protein AtMg00810-like [Capsicum annuum]
MTEPKTFNEAATDPRWMDIMQSEISALEGSQTWEIVKLPEGKKPIGSLINLQFKQSELDHSLFIKKSKVGVVIVLIYVDDILITGDSINVIEETKADLKKVFKMKDLGELKYFLGIEFARSKHGILMHQRKYSLELIVETGLGGAKPTATPVDTNTKLTTKEFDDYIKSTESSVVNDSLADQEKYQRLIGKLLYLTMTKPDIAFTLQTLSQYLQQPKQSHMEASMRVVRHTKNHLGQGVLLFSKSNTDITAYCDVDWAVCPHTRKSVSGYFVKLGDSLVSWKSKKQSTVSRSSAESEYRSMATIVTELV